MRKTLIITALAVLLAATVTAGVREGSAYCVGTVAAHAKPTVALANLGAGLVTSGTHKYKYTLVNAGGESLPTSATGDITTATATNGKVLVTIPTFVTNQTGANVYRTVTGSGGSYLLVNVTPILAAGVYTDNIADASLGGAAPGSNTTSPVLSDPTTAPTIALANLGAGLCTNGTHVAEVAFVTAAGINALSAASDPVTTAVTTNGKIVVTVAASANAAVTSVNIYLSKAGTATPFFLAASSVANTNGDTTLNIADTSLTSAAPTTDTASVETAITATSGKRFSYIYLRNNHASEKIFFTLDGSTPVQSVTSCDYISPAASSTAIDWIELGPLPYPRDGGFINLIRLRGETTAPVVTYRIIEE